MASFANRVIQRKTKKLPKIDNTKYYEDELNEFDDYLPQPTPKKYNTYPRQTKDPKYYEDYLLDDDNYDPILKKDNAKYSAELTQILSDQKLQPLRSAVEKKGDDLYDDLTRDVKKFNSDLETKSYLKEKGGKKKKKSSRKHGRTRSKRPRNTRRRRVSPKRNRGTRRK